MPPRSTGSTPPASSGDARHVVLVGLMGTGKTTLGRRLAARLGRPFVDSDEQLQAVDERTAREIEAQDGTSALDRAEVAALLDALADPEPAVIGAAAGVIEDPTAMVALRAPVLVVAWLRGDPATLAPRAAQADHRPWSAGGPLETLRAQAARRDPLYESVAAIVLDVNVDDLEGDSARLEAAVRRGITKDLEGRDEVETSLE